MKVIQRLKPKQKGAYQKKLKKVELDIKICAIPFTSWYSLAIKFGDHLFLKDGTLESLLYDSRDFFNKHNLNGFKSKKELEEIINFKRKKIKKFFSLPKIPKILINPNLWKNL